MYILLKLIETRVNFNLYCVKIYPWGEYLLWRNRTLNCELVGGYELLWFHERVFDLICFRNSHTISISVEGRRIFRECLMTLKVFGYWNAGSLVSYHWYL